MKTEEEVKRYSELEVRALADVLNSLWDIEHSVFEFDPSLRVFERQGHEFGVRYNVNNDDSYSVGIFDNNGRSVSLSRDEALSFAADIIAFAMHLEEINDPKI